MCVCVCVYSCVCVCVWEGDDEGKMFLKVVVQVITILSVSYNEVFVIMILGVVRQVIMGPGFLRQVITILKDLNQRRMRG